MSKKSRIKTADIALTEEQVAALLGEATTLQITHDGVLSAMNKELDAVRAKHEPVLNNIAADIQTRLLQVETWVRANKEQLFTEPRSRTYNRAEIGLRLGQWAVATVKGVTQKEAVKRLLKFRWGKQYVRQAETALDKAALLKDREKIKPERLLAANLEFVQDESFFFTPKTDAATAAPAATA